MLLVTLVDCLGHLAWCDGMLFDDEFECLSGILDQLQIPVTEQERVLKKKPALPDGAALRAACPDEAARRRLLGAALRLSEVDGDLADEEWVVVEQLCKAFEVPAEDWGQLQAWLGR